jgi:hypothetical protein
MITFCKGCRSNKKDDQKYRNVENSAPEIPKSRGSQCGIILTKSSSDDSRPVVGSNCVIPTVKTEILASMFGPSPGGKDPIRSTEPFGGHIAASIKNLLEGPQNGLELADRPKEGANANMAKFFLKEAILAQNQIDEWNSAKYKKELLHCGDFSKELETRKLQKDYSGSVLSLNSKYS